MKKCILNFATRANPGYIRGQRRLVRSLKDHKFKGDVITWTSENQFGSPPHRNVPYAFKPFALDWARKSGYDAALWLDASFYAVKPIEPVFDAILSEGHLMQKDGNRIGSWTHDKCLKKYGLTRDKAMKMNLYTAGCTGLNFSNDTSLKYLSMWKEATEDGESFIGAWKNNAQQLSKDSRCVGHRHDMSVGSIIAHQLGMKFQSPWSIFTYGVQKEFPNVYMVCRGM